MGYGERGRSTLVVERKVSERWASVKGWRGIRGYGTTRVVSSLGYTGGEGDEGEEVGKIGWERRRRGDSNDSEARMKESETSGDRD